MNYVMLSRHRARAGVTVTVWGFPSTMCACRASPVAMRRFCPSLIRKARLGKVDKYSRTAQPIINYSTITRAQEGRAAAARVVLTVLVELNYSRSVPAESAEILRLSLPHYTNPRQKIHSYARAFRDRGEGS